MVTEIEIPEAVSVDVPGGIPVIFDMDDMTSIQAWYDLLEGKELYQEDFEDIDQWRRYDYLSLGLLEGCVSCTGPERSGKTLWAVHTGHHLMRLFGKKTFCNLHPKEGYGPYSYMDEESFVEAWGKATEIAKASGNYMDGKSAGAAARSTIIDTFDLYNAIIIVDEAHKVLHCRRGNSAYALLLGDVIKEWGHNHNLVIALTPNVKELDKKLVLERRTHIITCSHNTHFEDTSTYVILSKRTERRRVKHIQPAAWGFLWDSWNIQGMRPVLKDKQGKKLKV